MEKRILTYRKYMDEMLTKEHVDWEALKKEHLTQIAFFAHERLVHLIVTVVFAILTVLCILMTFLMMALGAEGALGWFAVVLVFLVLLIPYIRHYFILENEVQKMYAQYDAIVAHISDGFFRAETTDFS